MLTFTKCLPSSKPCSLGFTSITSFGPHQTIGVELMEDLETAEVKQLETWHSPDLSADNKSTLPSF
jgi:hypothetical protein